MNVRTDNSLYLIGFGDAYDAIVDDLPAYDIDPTLVKCVPLAGPASLAADADDLLGSLDPQGAPLFIAVDAHALNHARLELYGRARLKGFRFASLVHRRAHVSPSAKLADNVWVGPMSVLSPGVKVASNTLIGAGVRIDCQVSVGAHCWIGAGCAIGPRTTIGSHCVLGADITLREATNVGRHSLIDQPGLWQGEIAAGTFVESIYVAPARMLGSGYSHQKKRAS